MTQPIFFDEIAQIFLVDGNFHLILGAATGEVAPNGKDVRSVVGKLIIPQNKLLSLIPELTMAVSQLTQSGSDNASCPELKESKADKKDSYDGESLVFKD